MKDFAELLWLLREQAASFGLVFLSVFLAGLVLERYLKFIRWQFSLFYSLLFMGVFFDHFFVSQPLAVASLVEILSFPTLAVASFLAIALSLEFGLRFVMGALAPECEDLALLVRPGFILFFLLLFSLSLASIFWSIFGVAL